MHLYIYYNTANLHNVHQIKDLGLSNYSVTLVKDDIEVTDGIDDKHENAFATITKMKLKEQLITHSKRAASNVMVLTNDIDLYNHAVTCHTSAQFISSYDIFTQTIIELKSQSLLSAQVIAPGVTHRGKDQDDSINESEWLLKKQKSSDNDFFRFVYQQLDPRLRYSGKPVFDTTAALLAASIAGVSFTIVGELSAETLNQQLFNNELDAVRFYILFAITELPRALFAAVNLFDNATNIKNWLTQQLICFRNKINNEAKAKNQKFNDYVNNLTIAAITVASASQSSYQTYSKFILNPSEQTQKMPWGFRIAAFFCMIITGLSSNGLYLNKKYTAKFQRQVALDNDGDVYTIRQALLKLCGEFKNIISSYANKNLDSTEARELIILYQTIKQVRKENNAAVNLKAYINKILVFVRTHNSAFQLEALLSQPKTQTNKIGHALAWISASSATLAALEQSIEVARLIFGIDVNNVGNDPYEKAANAIGMILYLANYDANVPINTDGLETFFSSIKNSMTNGLHLTERGWLEIIEKVLQPAFTVISGVAVGIVSSYFPLIQGAHGFSKLFSTLQGADAGLITNGIGWLGFNKLISRANQFYYEKKYSFSAYSNSLSKYNSFNNKVDKRRQLDFIKYDLDQDIAILESSLLRASKDDIVELTPVDILVKANSVQYAKQISNQVSFFSKQAENDNAVLQPVESINLRISN